MHKVLVLCTGNSCRSVMGEALINQLGKGKFLAVSAGSTPAGYVHPQSIAALERNGIHVDEPRSKSWDEFSGQPFDSVITVCDQAAGESCPIFLGKYRQIHWSIPDPAKVKGDDDVVQKAFDDALQMLKSRIENELL